jgi:hypothetical protein
VDPALKADLGRAALPRLLRPPHDLVQRHEVGRAAQVLGELALRECAEAAAEVADVRVLDVACDDVGDLVAADLAAEAVRGSEDALALRAAGTQEPGELLLAELRPGELERQGVAPDDERRRLVGARRPVALATQPDLVGLAQYNALYNRIQPVRAGELGVDGQALHKLELSRPGRLPQSAQVRPRSLGVDVVDRDRRDAAPVVDARVEQAWKVVEGEVRGCLDVDRRGQQQPRGRDRPEVVVE